jgi:hypothetical protein
MESVEMRGCKGIFVATLIIGSVLLALLVVSPVSPQPAPTPTPFTMQSLFEEDSCAPPCWFGLTPGESTAQDVEVLLASFSANKIILPLNSESREGVFDSETGYLVEGEYHFWWDKEVFEREEFLRYSNVIIIHQTLVEHIGVQPVREILLGELLSILGSPDHIIAGGERSLYMILIYAVPRMRVMLNGDRFQCNLSRFTQEFWVYSIDYFSSRYDVAYFDSSSEHFVWQDTWQEWLSGEMEGNCWDAWQQLPETTPVPTFTPAPTATAAP